MNIRWRQLIVLTFWFSCLGVITFLSALIYTAAQQNLRQSANDPQVQLAEDIASSIEKGQSPASLLSSNTIDITNSLAPFITVFDKQGNPIASSGYLDGKLPTLPKGVFDFTRQNGEDRITWQPRSGARFAVVITAFSGQTSGFVMAGRSLRETEIREDVLTKQVIFFWTVSLIFASIPFGLVLLKRGRE